MDCTPKSGQLVKLLEEHLICTPAAECPACSDSDGIDPNTVGTCIDSAGGLCDWRSGGCKDSCASTGSIYEYYCAGQATAQ